MQQVRHERSDIGCELFLCQLPPDRDTAFGRCLQCGVQARRKACLVRDLFEAFDQQSTRDAFCVGIGDEQIASVRLVEMMQGFSAPPLFCRAVLEQGVEILDRPGLAVVHLDLDDKLVPACDDRTGLQASWHVGFQVRLQILLARRFEHEACGRFGNEEKLQRRED